MARYLKITDGTTTIELDGDSAANYFNTPQNSWAPAVARQRNDILGGPLHTDVVETIPLFCESVTSIAVLLANIEALNSLINQAERWYLGEDVAPVIIRYSPTSDSTYLSAAVLGPPEGEAAITLPPNFEDYLSADTATVLRLELRFIRRGQWLGDEESDTGSGANNPSIITASLTATDIPSPTTIELSNFYPPLRDGNYLLVTDDADKIDIFSVSGLTATGFTTVNDAGNNPYDGTNILRYTPSDTNWHTSGNLDVKSLLLSDTRKIALFVSARCNGATTALIRIRMLSYVDITGAYYTVTLTTPYNIKATDEQWYYIGNIVLPVDLGFPYNYVFNVQLKASDTASTIDLNAVAMMDVRDEASNAVFLTTGQAAGYQTTLKINHRQLEKPLPDVTIGTDVAQPYRGGISYYSKTAEVAALYLATGTWVQLDNTLSVVSNALTARRRPGALIPQ